jgi:hypothetical protein
MSLPLTAQTFQAVIWLFRSSASLGKHEDGAGKPRGGSRDPLQWLLACIGYASERLGWVGIAEQPTNSIRRNYHEDDGREAELRALASGIRKRKGRCRHFGKRNCFKGAARDCWFISSMSAAAANMESWSQPLAHGRHRHVQHGGLTTAVLGLVEQWAVRPG